MVFTVNEQTRTRGNRFKLDEFKILETGIETRWWMNGTGLVGR